MKKFISYILLLILIAYSSGLVLQKIADYGLMGSKITSIRHWNSLLAGELNSDLIILGSSRGAVNYNPEVINEVLNKEALNLSFNAGSYNLQKVKLEIYLEYHDFPEVIIQNIDLAHFSTSRKIPEKTQFIPFLHNSLLRNKFREIEPEFGYAYYIPLVNYNHKINYLLSGFGSLGKEKLDYTPKDAFLPVNKTFKLDRHNLERLEQSRPDDFEKNRAGLISLIGFIENIPPTTKLILVWAPEYKLRLDITENMRNMMLDSLTKISNRYSNVKLYNYSSHPISKNENFFYDSFHLNAQGANEFSQILANDLKDKLD